MSKIELICFRTSLVVLGFLFASVGFGSAITGGLGGEVFSPINREFAFLIAQNHYQFYAGVFGAASLAIILCGLSPARYQQVARWTLGYIVIGGMCRFSLLKWDVLQDTVVLIALIFEIIVSAALCVWIWYRRDSLQTLV